MVIKYERVGDYVSAKVDATPEEIAALAAEMQERQSQETYKLVREPYQRSYSQEKAETMQEPAKPGLEHKWLRFELCYDDGPEKEELYRLLDRLAITRRELALIVMGLRVRPGFSLADFGT